MNKLAFIFVLLTVTGTATAQEWTQWRGPARDGSVTDRNAPAAWPESLKRTWRVEIGEGYSSPVVSAGRAFVHGRRDPEEIVASINLADGKILWEQKYQAPFKKNQYAVEMAKGPNATPLVAGNRLFTLRHRSSQRLGHGHWKTTLVQRFFKRDRHVETILRHRRFATDRRRASRGPGRERHSRRPDPCTQHRDWRDRVGVEGTWARLRVPSHD